MVCPEGNMQLCYDSLGHAYIVPVACINEPINYGSEYHIEKIKDREAPTEGKEVKVSNVTPDADPGQQVTK